MWVYRFEIIDRVYPDDIAIECAEYFWNEVHRRYKEQRSLTYPQPKQYKRQKDVGGAEAAVKNWQST